MKIFYFFIFQLFHFLSAEVDPTPSVTSHVTEPQTTTQVTEPQTTIPATEPQTTIPATEPKTTIPFTEPRTTIPFTEPGTTIPIMPTTVPIPIEEIIYKCNDSDTSEPRGIDDEVKLCIHFPLFKKKVAFKIRVDEYAVLTIKDGFSQLENKYNSLTNSANLNMNPRRKTLVEQNNEPTIFQQNPNQAQENKNIELIGQIGNIRTKFSNVS